MVVRALASVRSNELSFGFSDRRLTVSAATAGSGFEMFAVAIDLN
jgi:hypothetical protein